MIPHFIFLALAIIAIAIMMFFIGKQIERKQIKNLFKSDDLNSVYTPKVIVSNIEFREISRNGLWGSLLPVVILFAFYFAASYTILRQEYINNYWEGKIVENVEYHYQVVDSEKILKDSTVTYTKLVE